MSETTTEPMEGERLRFRSPRSDPPDPEWEPDESAETLSDHGRPEDTESLSRLSRPSAGEPPSRADIAAVFGGALLIAAALVSWGLRVRNKRLRPPNQHERMAMATPVARIFQRRVDIATAGPVLRDIADGCEAAAAVMAYAETEPVQSAVRAPEPTPPPEPGPDVETAYNALHGFGDEAP